MDEIQNTPVVTEHGGGQSITPSQSGSEDQGSPNTRTGLLPDGPLKCFHSRSTRRGEFFSQQGPSSAPPPQVQIQQIQQQPSKGHGGATATGITGMQMAWNTHARTCLDPVGRSESLHFTFQAGGHRAQGSWKSQAQVIGLGKWALGEQPLAWLLPVMQGRLLGHSPRHTCSLLSSYLLTAS